MAMLLVTSGRLIGVPAVSVATSIGVSVNADWLAT